MNAAIKANMSILTKDEETYVGALTLMFAACKNEIGEWTIKIDKTFSSPVVIYYAPAELVKTFPLDTDKGLILTFALGFAAGQKYGRRKATADKEAEFRNLLGINVDDDGKLYVSQA